MAPHHSPDTVPFISDSTQSSLPAIPNDIWSDVQMPEQITVENCAENFAVSQATLDAHCVTLTSLDLREAITEVFDAKIPRAGIKVLAIGEASHGTEEYFAVQAYSARYMIEERRSRVIALEVPADSATVLNRALRDSDAPIQDIILAFPYETWSNPQFLELFTWIRDWNLKHGADELVTVVGVDPKLAVRADPTQARSTTDLLATILGVSLDSTTKELYEQAVSFYAAAFKSYCEFMATGEEDKSSEAATRTKDAKKLIRSLQKMIGDSSEQGPTQLVELLSNALIFTKRKFTVAGRDALMAKKVRSYVATRAPSEGPVVLLAHSMHVGKQDSQMLGGLLSEKYADEYRVLVATSYAGSVTCSKRNTDDSNKKGLYTISPPPPDSFEQIFGAQGRSVFVDIREIGYGHDARFLREQMILMRGRQGAQPPMLNDFNSGLIPAKFCDGVFLLQETRGSRYPKRGQYQAAVESVKQWVNAGYNSSIKN